MPFFQTELWVGGGWIVLEEGVWDAVNIGNVLAGAEIAVNDSVAARGVLECAELEEMEHGGNVLKDGVLYAFEGEPARCGGKAVDLQWYAGGSLCKSGNETVAIVRHIGVGVKPHFQISPEETKIGVDSAVDQTGRIVDIRHLTGSLLLKFFGDEGIHHWYLADAVEHIGGGGKDGVGINHDAAAYAAGVALLHAAVIGEAGRYEVVRREGGGGFVPVENFHRHERHLLHRAVGIGARHRNPVAHMEAVVFGELYACHNTQNVVLENQHQYGRKSTEAAEERKGRFVNDEGDYDNGCDYPRNAFGKLGETAQGKLALIGASIDAVPNGHNERIDGNREYYDHIDEGDFGEESRESVVIGERELDEGKEYQRRHEA